MTCPHLVDSGVYVLGALAPAQRLEFEQHMATCPECRAEVNELAVLPGLLGRLDEPSVVGGAAELPTPSMLPSVLAKVHRQRRGRRVLAGAAAIVVAVLALVAGLNLPASAPAVQSPVSAQSSPAPVAVTTPIALHDMMPEDPDSAVTAQVGFTPVLGGTQIELKCQYPLVSGSAYTGKKWFGLYAIPRNGKPAQELGTWTVKPGDKNSGLPATVTSWSVPQMSRLELRDLTGSVVLFYNF